MIPQPTSVLCVDLPTAGHGQTESWLAPLFDGPVELLHAATLADALAILRTRPVDLILIHSDTDTSPDGRLHAVRHAAPHCPVIAVLNRPDEAASLTEIRRGAHETLSLTGCAEGPAKQVLARAFARVGRDASALVRPPQSAPTQPASTTLLHDLNNLMTSVNGFADLLLARLATDDPARSSAEQIRQAGKRAAALLKSHRQAPGAGPADAPAPPASSPATAAVRAA
jgi:signal transduction histidine kinase